MRPNEISKQTKFLTSLGAISIVLIHIIREQHWTMPPFCMFIIGVAPNFFGAILVNFLVLYVLVRFADNKQQYSKDKLLKKLFLSAFIAFSSLIMWEIIQKIVWNYSIDYNDIVATFLGVVFSSTVFMLSMTRFNV